MLIKFSTHFHRIYISIKVSISLRHNPAKVLNCKKNLISIKKYNENPATLVALYFSFYLQVTVIVLISYGYPLLVKRIRNDYSEEDLMEKIPVECRFSPSLNLLRLFLGNVREGITSRFSSKDFWFAIKFCGCWYDIIEDDSNVLPCTSAVFTHLINTLLYFREYIPFGKKVCFFCPDS